MTARLSLTFGQGEDDDTDDEPDPDIQSEWWDQAAVCADSSEGSILGVRNKSRADRDRYYYRI